MADHVSIHVGLIPDRTFGTNAGLPAHARWERVPITVSGGSSVERVTAPHGIPNEVRQLRDEICARGLNRQDVARALGVDRRSLSGWVSGSIRPGSTRIALMRLFAKLVADIDDERPGRARELLLARHGGTAMIDRVASDGAALLGSWRSATRPAATVTVTASRPPRLEPLWAAAARAVAEGVVGPVASRGTVRPDSQYDVEPGDAAAFEEPEPEHRRSRYR